MTRKDGLIVTLKVIVKDRLTVRFMMRIKISLMIRVRECFLLVRMVRH